MNETEPTVTVLDVEVSRWKQVVLCLVRMIFRVHLPAGPYCLIQLTSIVDWKDHSRVPSMVLGLDDN